MPTAPIAPELLQSLLAGMDGRSAEERRELLRSRAPGQFPPFLYKYCVVPPAGDATAMRRLRDLIVDCRLWLAAPQVLRDPFALAGCVAVERNYHVRYSIVSEGLIAQSPALTARQRRLRRKQLLAHAPELLERELQARFEQLGSAYGICSFGGDPFSVPMWAQHAADHSGICLQFEVVRDFALFARADPVEYGREVPVIDWTGDLEAGMREVLLRRHESWKHEKERRILAYGGAGNALEYRPEALAGVILGCRIDEGRRQCVMQLLSERRSAGMPEVAVFQAERHPRRYELGVRRLR